MKLRSFIKGTFCLQLLTALSLLLVQGCASDKEALGKFNEEYQVGHYPEALKICKEESEDLKDEENILWNLQHAMLERELGNWKASNETIAKCEVGFNAFLDESNIDNAGEVLKQMLLNDSFTDYEGSLSEYILLSTYRAINSAGMGDFKKANSYFFQTLERQKNAEELFAKKIEEQESKIKKAIEEKDSDQRAKAEAKAANAKQKSKEVKDEKQSDEVVAMNYSDAVKAIKKSDELKNLENQYDQSVKAYKDFINPFSTYIAGLFYLLEGEDFNLASERLKQAHQMTDSKNLVVGADWLMADKSIKPSNKVWIIFENGLCPIKEEFRIDLPVGLLSKWVNMAGRVKYFGIALPKLKFRSEAYPFLTLKAGKDESKTLSICELDGIVKHEFDLEYPVILTREITRQIIKTVAQYFANRVVDKAVGGIQGEVLKWVVGAAQAATTAADIRSCTALPKNYQLASANIPADRSISIVTPEGSHYPITIPECNNAIIFVRIPSKAVQPQINIIKFK